MLFYFGRDANIVWQHGINALPEQEQDGKGRISIILWGLCTTTVDEAGSPPMLTDDSRGKGKGKGKDKGKGKGKEPSPCRKAPRLRFKASSWSLGKPSGLECEDACFANSFSLGVADGVGSMVQFARFGVNSAAYAADLMERADAALSSNQPSDVPVELRALEACKAAEEQSSQFGASTISVMALEGNTIGCANLGDSGFMILRKESAGTAILHKSADQQHSWNCPYQLMRIPPALAAKFPNFPQDHAVDSESYRHEVEEGDLILMFSDGIKDNLHPHEILSIVDRCLSPAFANLMGLPSHATDPEVIARALAQAAQVRSRDPRARVPFTLYSLDHGYDCLGGKEDDITLVAAWLVPDTAEITLGGLS
jgi:protein phosphatase PTC7